MERNYWITSAKLAPFVEIDLPASKSISNRLLIMDALTGGNGKIDNISVCDDVETMQTALRQLSRHSIGTCHIDVGASGTAMRFLTAYIANKEGSNVILDGFHRLKERPISDLVKALQLCGAEINFVTTPGEKSNYCNIPIHILGHRLQARRPITLRGDISSQFISAMMLIAPYMENGLVILLQGDTVSRPYIEMTASLMRSCGAEVSISGAEIRIEAGNYAPICHTVENDWSAASYWYELTALSPALSIRLKGLRENSLQGDRYAAELFSMLGVTTVFDNEGATLRHTGEKATRLELDLSGHPDLAQAAAVTACLTGVPFLFTGLATLRIKETDRIEALRSQLAKLGYPIRIGLGRIEWSGMRTQPETQISIDTFNDHRMAMAFAPAAICFPGIEIRNADVVGKSYPKYWKELETAGFRISNSPVCRT